MWKDPIVEEVRQARERHAARFDYDLAAICQDLREHQAGSGHRVVRRDPKTSSPELAAIPAKRSREPRARG